MLLQMIPQPHERARYLAAWQHQGMFQLALVAAAGLLGTVVNVAHADQVPLPPAEPPMSSPLPEDSAPVSPVIAAPSTPAAIVKPAPPPIAAAAPDALRATGSLGKGVTLVSADKQFRFNMRARMQLRVSQFSSETGEPPEQTEFQARRVRLLIQGHVLGGALTYYLQLGFANLDNEPDMRVPLRDAYLTYQALRDLTIRAGQMKVPFGRQRVVSSSALQMVDRSIVVGELNLDRDVGIQVLSDDLFGLDGKLAYNVGVFSGDGRNRLAANPGVLVVGRVAVRPLGGFDDLVEADLERQPKPKLAVAVAVAHNSNSNRQRSTFNTPYTFATFDYTHATADAMVKYRGASLITEVIYRRASRSVVEQTLPNGDIDREFARNAWGYYVQGGYMINKQIEFTGRFSELRPWGQTDPSLATIQRELGGGANWYLQGHSLKLQADYFRLFGPDLGDGRHQFRLQGQLFF